MRFRASPTRRQILDGLSRKGFSGKPKAAFDIQLKSKFSSGAAKGIEGKPKSMGFKLITDPLIAHAQGKLRHNEWRLKE